MPRVIALLAVALAALVALPAPAPAHHLRAAVAIDGTLGKARKKDGARLHTISWTVTCGDPKAIVELAVGRQLQPKNPKRRPVSVGNVSSRAADQGPGSVKMWVAPGSRWKPVIDVTCLATDVDGSVHDADAAADGPVFHIPPRLVSWRMEASERCGLRRGGDRKLQVGMFSVIELDAAFDAFTTLRHSKRGVVLRFRGGGRRARVKARDGSWRQSFALPTPKRPGKAKVWMELDGVPTNKLTIPIAPLKGSCRQHATG